MTDGEGAAAQCNLSLAGNICSCSAILPNSPGGSDVPTQMTQAVARVTFAQFQLVHQLQLCLDCVDLAAVSQAMVTSGIDYYYNAQLGVAFDYGSETAISAECSSLCVCRRSAIQLCWATGPAAALADKLFLRPIQGASFYLSSPLWLEASIFERLPA